jgi:hypothetical protein
MSSENLNDMEFTNFRDEYEYEYEEDEDEYYEEDDEVIDTGNEIYKEHIAYIKRVNEINAYNQRILAKQIEEDQRLENDPFYQAACALVIDKSIEMFEVNEKLKIDTFRNIVRRQMEKTNENINSGDEFTCEYEVIESLIDEKVKDDMTKIFGAKVKIFFNNFKCCVYIFDGNRYHEFFSDVDMIQMMEVIKREIRCDASITLYDVGFCKDIAGIISEYIC